MSTILVDFRAWKSSSEISEMLALLKDAAQLKGAANGNEKHKKAFTMLRFDKNDKSTNK